ncbi:PepSY-associated TM helix domain-containing protein [Eleftheria terrae]|uniref:PepSY-associated TM helix domain-containing protein n=1 Tax=Eleftheria terrae TaxID=1597781 RepID=UPI00263B4041|nr:PepSY-associated TM helix domain-containing protein [Eleftheria terrae]WKB55602.1 PepSY domain-containing protein [Eleftheria terrae]
MKEGFRQSMSWLHTYSGLLVGWVLFMVFAAGTASYFKDEISFWMRPELHLADLHAPPQAEVAERAFAALQQRGAQGQRWFVTLPTEREPGVRASWMRAAVPRGQPEAAPEPGVSRRGRFDSALLDATTGRPLQASRDTRGGEFFYRLHFDLHYMPPLWARWIIGFCAMFMLVAIVSGVVTHRRIFADFFTFRPGKGQRSWLDAHNAVAVLALPYHLMITYTGLVTLMLMYMPWGPQLTYKGDTSAFLAEVFPANGPRDPKPSGISVPMVPVGPLVTQATSRWGGAPVGRITVNNPNDAAATIVLSRQEGHDMSSTQPAMTFSGATGRLISEVGEEPGAATATRSVLYGLHIGRFGDPLLRALFFLSGLAGCVMVATGLLLWAVKERNKYSKAAARGLGAGWALRLVDGLNVGTIAGLPIAMAAFFWGNRLLPLQLHERAQAEIHLFFAAWALAAIAALARPTRRMWLAQLGIAAFLFGAIPLLNALTTDTHLGATLPAGLWRVAGFDLVCLAMGAAFAYSAWWLARKDGRPMVRKQPAHATGLLADVKGAR